MHDEIPGGGNGRAARMPLTAAPGRADAGRGPAEFLALFRPMFWIVPLVALILGVTALLVAGGRPGEDRPQGGTLAAWHWRCLLRRLGAQPLFLPRSSGCVGQARVYADALAGSRPAEETPGGSSAARSQEPTRGRGRATRGVLPERQSGPGQPPRCSSGPDRSSRSPNSRDRTGGVRSGRTAHETYLDPIRSRCAIA